MSQIKKEDNTKNNLRNQVSLRQNKLDKSKLVVKTSNNEQKNIILYKSTELDERRLYRNNRNNKEDIKKPSVNDPKQITYNSQAIRRSNKTIEIDNSKKINLSSYENRKAQQIKNVDNKYTTNNNYVINNYKYKRTEIQTKNELPKRNTKTIVSRRIIPNNKDDKSNISFDVKTIKLKNEIVYTEKPISSRTIKINPKTDKKDNEKNANKINEKEKSIQSNANNDNSNELKIVLYPQNKPKGL